MTRPLNNENGQIKVFKNDGKFISQDTAQLTTAGAKFYANILDDELAERFKSVKN